MQVATLRTRMASAEKALVDANSRASDAASRAALAEADGRIKVQELNAKVSNRAPSRW